MAFLHVVTTFVLDYLSKGVCTADSLWQVHCRPLGKRADLFPDQDNKENGSFQGKVWADLLAEFPNIWKSNKIFLSSPQVKQGITKEIIRKPFELNDNENTTYKNLCNAVKAVFRGKCVADQI